MQSKYVTQGVTETIPSYIQNILWFMVEKMVVDKKDYLQIFVLDAITVKGKVIQKVIHMQEQPAYKKEHLLPVTDAIKAKVYIIDDKSHSTMLLASEY